jgi:hypothetical protein
LLNLLNHMNTAIKRITDNVNEQFYVAKQAENQLERINNIFRILEQGLLDLKEFVKVHGFNNAEDEIEYFKIIKPSILAQLIEEGIKHSLSINKPITTIEHQIKYFEDQLISFQSFFQINALYYQYYKNHLTNLDESYFLRSSKHLDVPLTDTPETDRKYMTPMCSLFARFIAYENVQYFLLEQITILKHPELKSLSKAQDNVQDLRWTGDAVNIIELTYGIYLTGQINNGNVSLNQVVRWMERNLGVTIGNIQSRFAEISARKRVGPTKFIDQMKQNILQKLEDDNR